MRERVRRVWSRARRELRNAVVGRQIDHKATREARLRVVRPGGVLFYALPDVRSTEFDRERARTTVEHLLRDHREGPSWSRRDHYRDWVRLAERFDEEDVERRAAELEAERA